MSNVQPGEQVMKSDEETGKVVMTNEGGVVMKKERKNRSGGRMVSNSKAKIQEGIRGGRGSGPVVGLSDQKTFGKKLGARGVTQLFEPCHWFSEVELRNSFVV